MKIYTKTGDGGLSSLANGQRVSKADLRIEAYGTADELNAFVGLLRCKLKSDTTCDSQIDWIQNKLFNLGAYLACAAGEWIVQDDVVQLEQWIDTMQKDIPPTHAFVLPAGDETTCLSHVCRTITRRLERQIIILREKDMCKCDEICKFVNRLSDFWFVFSQKCEKNAGNQLFLWKK